MNALREFQEQRAAELERMATELEEDADEQDTALREALWLAAAFYRGRATRLRGDLAHLAKRAIADLEINDPRDNEGQG